MARSDAYSLRTGAFVLLLVALLGLSVPVANADHGAWLIHTYTFWDSSPSTYSGYARLQASDPVDFCLSRFRVYRDSSQATVVDVQVSTPFPVDEGCGPIFQTPTKAWSQGGGAVRVQSWNCGFDGSHSLSGTWFYLACTTQGVAAHIHTSGPVN